MKTSNLALSEAQYCILDLETTGLDPINDGIVEISSVRIDAQGNKLDEFHSLINPRQPVRCTEIHGITDDDVADAPEIADVCGQITRLLSGSVVVAFNAYFDVAFLEQKVLRPLSLKSPHPFLCCMYLRGMIGLKPARARLAQACKEAGIEFSHEHQAYFDTNAVALLFENYLRLAVQSGLSKFADLRRAGKRYKFVESWELSLPTYPWQSYLASCPKPRITAEPQLTRPSQLPLEQGSSYIDNLLSRVWETVEPHKQKGYEEYLSCLSSAISDRVLTQAELDQLRNIAVHYGMSVNEIRRCHEQFYQLVLNEALEDRVLTDDEKRDLEKLTKLLGL
jgi:DNA polymerase-3 subunit epsilon